MKKLMVSVLAAVCAATAATAATAAMPLQLGIAGDTLQLCNLSTPVCGLKLNVPYADSDDAAGLDIGFVGAVGEFKGLRLNAVNLSRDCSRSLELGLMNIAYGEVHGMQFGAFNHAEDMHGFQLGIINHAGNLYGLQLGLFNIVVHGTVKAFPFIIYAF